MRCGVISAEMHVYTDTVNKLRLATVIAVLVALVHKVLLSTFLGVFEI